MLPGMPSIWSGLSRITATGGSVTSTGGYTIHTFNSSGTFEITSGRDKIEYLVIGGGGGGGFDGGGGGGAGGYRTGTLIRGTGTYTVTVGAGGAGAASAADKGTNGDNSVFDTITALGGGGGGSSSNVDGASGGSGGGARQVGGLSGPHAGGSGTVGQGNNGGSSTTTNFGAGGGGGAGAVGANGTTGVVAGAGGNGLASSITGSSVTRAGGGGGGSSSTAANGGTGGGGNGSSVGTGGSGTANTGGGGGGGAGSGGNRGGGAGGSGIVVVRYKDFTSFSIFNTAAAWPSLGNVSTHNFGSLPVGPASSNRHVILLLEGHNGSTGGIDFTGATCNGNAMTQLFAPVHGGGGGESKAVAGYIFALPSGTTATFSATSSNNLQASYALFSMLSGNPTPSSVATDTDTTLSQSLTISAGGAAVGIAGGTRTSIGTATWTNMDSEVLDTGINANNGVTAALHSTAGSATRSVAWSGGALSIGAMALVAFEPA